MARARKYDVTAGRVYIGKKQHRRVIATFHHVERGLRVIYSVGGDSNRECGYVQFRRWATATEAKAAVTKRTPNYQLRQEDAR